MNTHANNEVPSGAIAAAWSVKRLWLLHVAGNALLLAAGYAWLWIPDASIWQLVVSALLGLVAVLAALWLHGGTLAFFGAVHHGEGKDLWPEFRAALRRLPALIVWLLVVLTLLWLIGLADDRVEDWGDLTASWLTLHLHKPVHPEGVYKAFSGSLWTLRWILVPIICLPIALQVALQGFAGFARAGLRGAWRVFRSIRWWLGYVLLFAVAWYLPEKIVSWVPKAGTLQTEAASASARFLLAYVLTVSGWIVLLSLLGRLGAKGDDGHPVGVREPVPVSPGKGHSAIGMAE